MISLTLIRDLFIHPRKVWQTIADSNAGIRILMFQVLIPLLLIPTLFSVIGWVLIGKSTSGDFFVLVERGWKIGLEYGLVYFISTAGALLASALVLAKATPAFRGAANRDNAFRLLLYAWIPVLLSGIFLIVPSLFWLQIPFVLYAFLLIRLGAGHITHIPAAARTVYSITAAFIVISCLAVAFIVTRGILKLLFFG